VPLSAPQDGAGVYCVIGLNVSAPCSLCLKRQVYGARMAGAFDTHWSAKNVRPHVQVLLQSLVFNKQQKATAIRGRSAVAFIKGVFMKVFL